MPTFEQAVAQLTGPDGLFAMHDEEIDGQRLPVFDRTPTNLGELFATLRTRPADDVYLVYEDERWSFADVMAHVDALGALLVDRYGVGKGDRVAIGMRNYPEWVIAFAAITSIGAISVSLNAWWTEDELDYALEDSGTSVLIADVERVQRTRAALA